MNVPNDLLYTEEHEWLSVDGTTVRLGITDYAQDQLGDIVYVDLPEVGAELGKDDIFAEVESTKSVGEVYAPFDGVVTATNDVLADTPELVNSDPYGAGWLIEMTVDTAIQGFLDADAYRALTE
ncbi:MAG TPA: glycine cleavage system protein GcvH [Acidimicrobiia bacterium]|jgi:glycine cleavage system H protein